MIDVAERFGAAAECGAGRLVDLAALGELSAVLAHELRNPLSSIKGAAQILQQEWGAQKPQSEFLNIILDEVETLTALATEFMEFSRPLYPELAWCSWNDTVEAAVLSVQSIAQAADMHVELELAEDLPRALLDGFQISRALRNLLLNAMDASTRGATVVVRTQRTPEGVAAEIEDAGCGMPQEQMARIFVPFFTTKLAGTGLGLPVARKIAQNHGGDVFAVRNDGPGMTFVIHLPAPSDLPDG
ncbi:MAG TPA: ATP-binding protein [Armatimonadota bacterium]